MQNSKGSFFGFLVLILIAVFIYLYFIEEPTLNNGLPELSKTIFVELDGRGGDKEDKIKVVLNNDNSATYAVIGGNGNNAGSYCKWRIESQNNEMIKVLLETGNGNFLITIYQNKEASLTDNRYQFHGRWYQ